MFPVIDSISNHAITKQTNLEGKKTFQFDFSVGEFIQKDGSVTNTESIGAVKVWVEKILRTERNKFPIYDETYGVSLLRLVNSEYPQDFVEAEVKREVTETLMRNKEITSVENFVFEREKHRLVCNFTIRTIYGMAFESVVNL